MKLIFTTFLSLFFLATFGQRIDTLKPDAQKYLIINGKTAGYKPGDKILLRGYFKAVAVYDLVGVTITNVPGETLIVGDSTWPGGSWGHGFAFRNCHYINVGGTNKASFKVIGSNSTVKDANGYPVRTAYMDFAISELSDNFVVHDITIRHGGVGILAKTDVTSNSATWYPNTFRNNFEFYNLDIYNTYNEALYLGHTAAYWNIKTNQPAYPKPGDTYQNDATIYKLPIKLKNVKIHDNYIHDIGNDGIQTAAIDGLEVYNNEVVNWATKHEGDHCGGLLIGGRVKGINAHDNHVHDGWGEPLQCFAEGGAPAVINNNLFTKANGEGASFRGTNNLLVDFTNNTVAIVGGNLVRVNAYFGGTKVNLSKNILAGPLGGSPSTTYPKNFIYLENGGTAGDNDNIKTASGSDIAYTGYGYKTSVIPQPEPSAPAPKKMTIASSELAGLFKALKPGTHELTFTFDDSTSIKVSMTVTK